MTCCAKVSLLPLAPWDVGSQPIPDRPTVVATVTLNHASDEHRPSQQVHRSAADGVTIMPPTWAAATHAATSRSPPPFTVATQPRITDGESKARGAPCRGSHGPRRGEEENERVREEVHPAWRG